jgi:hypothetical protein
MQAVITADLKWSLKLVDIIFPDMGVSFEIRMVETTAVERPHVSFAEVRYSLGAGAAIRALYRS